jgi:hypothetical protein
MSWSLNVVGKVAAVRKNAQQALANITCIEPEETIKNAVGRIIDDALCAFPSNVAVQITAGGSQYKPDQHKEGIINSVSLEIKPLYGFVE